MPVSPARRIAYQVLRRVERGLGFAADLLRAPGLSSLSESDRNLATELVLGTLRRRAELHWWIEALSGKPLKYFDPEIATILELGVYQIRLLERIPKAAVVNEAVEMAKAARKRSAAGLVNAVLRKCEPAGRPGEAIDDNSLRLALPGWLSRRWSERFGAKAERALARWSLAAPATVVRVTSRGEDVEAIRRELAVRGIEAKPALYAPWALILEGTSVTRQELWRTGRLVIQEEASQLVAPLLKPEAGQSVLDLCAAPGMKSAQIAAELGEGLLISCDRSSRRLRSMAETLAGAIPPGVRWYRVQADVTSHPPFAMLFDRILLDAPCSGTGTLARNPEIKWRLAPEDIARLARQQARMLEGALGALQPHGRLVYSTCSLEPEENEEVVEKVLTERAGFRRAGRAELVRDWPALATLFDDRGYFRTRPDLHGTDGFFAAVITREA